MIQPHYDMVVVGGGPAGLSAARTAARLGFRTLLLEGQDRPERRACSGSAVLAPVPGFAAGLRCEDGALYFPALDLRIPLRHILGTLGAQRIISPSGYEFQADFALRADFPIVVVDRRALLAHVAGQAAAVGAELRYGTRVAGLLRGQGTRIAGVVTAAGEQIWADVVLAAEGVARVLVEDAGLSGGAGEPRRYTHILTDDLQAPGAGVELMGQMVTLGARYTAAGQAYGTVVVPAPGRATVHFTMFDAEEPAGDDAHSWRHLDEYMQNDPRVRGILARARSLGRQRTVIQQRAAPRQVVRDGLLAVGDAVTQGGRLGLLPAVHMGRQAALVAAEAVEAGEASAERLAGYQQFYQTLTAGLLDVEDQTLYNLTRLPDEQIDRFCLALGRWNLGAPSFGNWRAVAWESLTGLVRQLPALAQDWDMLQQTLQIWSAAGPAAWPFGIALSVSGRYLANADECVPAVPKGRR